MSIVLSIYKKSSAFREVVLADQGAGEMQILLDRHLFHLNQDIKLKLEKGEDYWILKADDYLIHQKKSDSFFHETAICDGLNVNIVRGPDNVTITIIEE